MRKIFLLLLMPSLAILSACPPNCGEQGRLPIVHKFYLNEFDTKKVPYQSGDTLTLLHSAGSSIQLLAQVERDSLNETYCDECCSDSRIAEYLAVNFKEDVPFFPLSIQLEANEGEASLWIRAGNSYFTVWGPPDKNSYEVQGQVFEQVYTIKGNEYYYTEAPSIRLDSLYYSYTDGIIAIILTNGEQYVQVPN